MKTIIDFTNKVKSLVDGRISNIANVEESPSTHAYTVGKQLIFNGLLCKATSAIAVGDTLAVGTNLTLSDNVVEQIYSLNQGLSNSLNNEIATRAKLGGHNLFKVAAETLTIQGVTFTRNSDGSFTVNGTASGNIYYNLTLSKFLKFEDLDYILTGCPSGGSEDSYSLFIRSNEADSSQWQYAIDYGNGISFLADSSRKYVAFMYVKDGYTISNKTFSPMIRLATDESADYEPYSMTNREMTPYVQAISNPNLLDNPWFTVNQRGQSSYTIVNAYSVDRWKTSIDNTNLSCTISINSNNSLTVSAPASNMWFFQNGPIIDLELLKGKTITLSVDATASDNNSGRLYSSFFANNRWEEFDATNIPAGRHITSLTFTVPSSFAYTIEGYTSFGINIYSNKSITIHSTKLEIGNVSTLHMDTAPNYQQELAKCQRYFQRIRSLDNVGFTVLATGVMESSTRFWGVVPLPVEMNRKPTITSFIGSNSVRICKGGVAAVDGVPVTSIDLDVLSTHQVKIDFYCASQSSIPVGTYCTVWSSGNSNVYIDLSADL